MDFLLSDLKSHRFILKDDEFEPLSFLGDPPELMEYDSPLRVKVRAELINTEVLVSGTVSTTLKCICGRCLKKFEKNFEGRFKQTFESNEMAINVDGPIKDAVIVDLPLNAVCREKCKGLCPHCGQNRNETECDCTPSEGSIGWNALKDFRFPKQTRRNNG